MLFSIIAFLRPDVGGAFIAIGMAIANLIGILADDRAKTGEMALGLGRLILFPAEGAYS